MYLAAKEAICAAQNKERNEGQRAKIIGDVYFSEKDIVVQRRKGNIYAHNFLSLCQVADIASHCDEFSGDAIGLDSEKVLSELKRDCHGVIDDLNNKTVVPAKVNHDDTYGRDIYIRRRRIE